MGSIVLAAVTAVVLHGAKPPASLDEWGVEVGGGVAYDRYEPANALPVGGPLWSLELRLRSPWGLSVGLVGMTASGTKDTAGSGNTLSRKMLGIDLEYGLAFPLGTSVVGRAWVGVGVAAGSTTYDHVDEPYSSDGHVREFRFGAGVDFLVLGTIAVGPWIGSAWGDTTATVYGGQPERVSYSAFNVGGRVLLVF
jgi:hypothetical protein